MGRLSEAGVFWTSRRSCPLGLLPGVTQTDHIPSEVVPTLCSLGPGNFLASEVAHCPYNGIVEAGFESLGHDQLGLLSHRDLWKAQWLLVVRVNCADVFKRVSLVTRKLLCQNDRWAAAAPPPCVSRGRQRCLLVKTRYLCSSTGLRLSPGNHRKLSRFICPVAGYWPTGMGALGDLGSVWIVDLGRG